MDFTGNNLYKYIEADLSTLTNDELNNLLEESLKRHSGHPTGSSAHAQSSGIIMRVEKEISKRESAKNKKNELENLTLSRLSYSLNRKILFFTILSTIISLIGVAIAIFK